MFEATLTTPFHEERLSYRDPGRSSGSWFFLLLTPSRPCQPVACREFRPTYSGGTTGDLHPFPLARTLDVNDNFRTARRKNQEAVGSVCAFETALADATCFNRNSLWVERLRKMTPPY
jgi:hypothetical protein